MNSVKKKGAQLLALFTVALIIASAVFVDSLAFAASWTVGSGSNTITFETIASEADFDYSSSSNGYIYLNETTIAADSVTVSTDGKTLTDGDDITITIANGLTFRTTSSGLLGHTNTANNCAYEITTTESLTSGDSRTYGGSSASPAITIKVTNAGTTSNGKSVDVVYTISTISVLGYYYSPVNQTNGPVCLMEFVQGQDLFANGPWFYAYYGGVQADCTVSIYYSGTTNLASGYDIVWRVVDIDISSKADTTDYGGTYAEAILFKSGFTNPVYVPETRTTATDTYTYNGTEYARIYGLKDDTSTFTGGFMTKVSGGEFSFVWIGSGCGTKITLAGAQTKIETGSLTVTKEVTGDASTTQQTASYNFTVQLDSSVSDVFQATYSDSTTVTITFENGMITKVGDVSTNSISLTNGQSITISGLLAGTNYTVTEDTSSITGSYTVLVNGSESADAKAEGTISGGALSEVTFENRFEAGDLVISKTVSGDGASVEQAFTFVVTLLDDDTPISDTYEATHTGDATITSVTFDENGQATFYLKANESITIIGLPAGVSYTVEEEASEGYTTTVSVDDAGFESDSSAIGTIISGQTTEIAFNNHKTTDTETTTTETDDPDDPSTPDNPETPTDDPNTTTDDADTTTDGSLPTTGDTTNPRLSLYAAITSALAVSAIASGFILRRRNRYQGAHFRRI